MKTTVQRGPLWAGLVAGFSGSRTEVRGLVDYCRVFSAEDAVRWALQAYMQASRYLEASEGPWVEGGVPWSSPHGFADDFQHEFERRLWDACQRSPRYREVQAWKDAQQSDASAADGDSDAEGEPDLLRSQMPALPQCGSVAANHGEMGVSGAL